MLGVPQNTVENIHLCSRFLGLFLAFFLCKGVNIKCLIVQDRSAQIKSLRKQTSFKNQFLMRFKCHELRILCQPLFFWIYCKNISFEVFHLTILFKIQVSWEDFENLWISVSPNTHLSIGIEISKWVCGISLICFSFSSETWLIYEAK